MAIWYKLWQFGIVFGHLVYFSHFGMFGPRTIWQPCVQCDQFGRIFVKWEIVYFGQFCEYYKSSPNFMATFFHGKSYKLIWTKNGLGYILCDFFTNASGHPASLRDTVCNPKGHIFEMQAGKHLIIQ
jgi:hypothetical protein